MIEQTALFTAKPRRRPDADTDNGRVLRMLELRPTYNSEFVAAGIPNFRSRLSDLREMGYDIPRYGERVSKKLWLFCLRSK